MLTRCAKGNDGKIEALECVRVEWVKGADGRMEMREVEGSTFELKADLVLLAMGFLSARHNGLVQQSGAAVDARGNVKANTLELQDDGRESIFLRRHAPWPVAGRLGDPRRPPGSPRGG